jgi:hypothetical protein
MMAIPLMMVENAKQYKKAFILDEEKLYQTNTRPLAITK